MATLYYNASAPGGYAINDQGYFAKINPGDNVIGAPATSPSVATIPSLSQTPSAIATNSPTTSLMTPTTSVPDTQQNVNGQINQSPDQITAQQPATSSQAPTEFYTVKPGDTLNKIASQFGVLPQQIQGYKSGNPNLIYPGEVLSVNKTTNPSASPTSSTPTQTSQQSTGPITRNLAAEQAFVQSWQGKGGRLPTAAEINQSVYGTPNPSFNTPQGQQDGQQAPDQQQNQQNLFDILKQEYGIDINPQDFLTKPETSIKDLASQIMSNLNLPDVKGQIDTINKTISDLSTERDNKIASVNSNPWLSEGQRASKINHIQQAYDTKINTQTNLLNLQENAYNDARQTAQWVTSQAVDLYTKQQSTYNDRLKLLIDQAEKTLTAKQKLTQPLASSYRSIQGGIYDITNQKWLVPPTTKQPTTARTGTGTRTLPGTTNITLTPTEKKSIAAIGASSFPIQFQNVLLHALTPTQRTTFMRAWQDEQNRRRQSIDPVAYLQQWAREQDQKSSSSSGNLY